MYRAYRIGDAVLPPGLLSAARVPLAALFPRAFADGAGSAAVVLAAAGLSDVLDGRCARALDMATPTGAAIDAVADKVFVGTVVTTLVARGALPASEAPLLFVRELMELPLTAWFVTSGRAEVANDVDHPRSNAAGKAATTLQLATLAAAALGAPRGLRRALVAATAIAGALAGVLYARRELARAALRAPTLETEGAASSDRPAVAGAAVADAGAAAGPSKQTTFVANG